MFLAQSEIISVFSVKYQVSFLKIINCGNGLHKREVKGIEALASLPSNWFAYTNLDLATAPGSSREIDAIIVAQAPRRRFHRAMLPVHTGSLPLRP
jgi:hypothetical protein